MSRTNYKNHFFDIQITSRDGKRSAALTENVKRLIESVDITESLVDQEGAGPGQVTLVFKQMDFLPDDNALRPQDPKVFGEITNRTAAVTDLRFDSERGFTFVSKDEIEAGRVDATRNQRGRTEPIIYLLQGGNYIDITWGYLEPYKARTNRYQIAVINHSTGAAGDTVTVQAFDTIDALRNSKSSEGITFIENDKRLSLKQVLYKIAHSQGIKLQFDGIVVERYPEEEANSYNPNRERKDKEEVSKIDSRSKPEAPFTLPRGLNLKEYLDQLSDEYDSYYTIQTVTNESAQPTIVRFEPDSVEGRREFTRTLGNKKFGDIEQILVFKKVPQFYEKVSYKFRFRDENGSVLNITLKSAEYQGDATTATSGGSQEETFESQKRVAQLVEQDTRPEFANRTEREQFTLALGTKRVRQSVTTPAETQESTQNYTDTFVDALKYFATIELVTIGDPEHTPSLVEIDNLGVRYSGKYRMVSVEHKLSAAGYTTSWRGKREDVNEAGVSTDSLKAEEIEVRKRRSQLVIQDT